MKQIFLTICLIFPALLSLGGFGDVYYSQSDEVHNMDERGQLKSYMNQDLKLFAREDKISFREY